LPRRHTSSAAGALAAALLAAVSAPAAAQDGAPPPLRGSIGAQEDADGAPPSAARAARRRQTFDGSLDADDAGARGAGSDPPSNLADDPSLMPPVPAPPPPLGGLGDEPAEPVPAVPEFGVTTATGLPLVEPPSIDDDLEQLPLPPRGHELDPYVPIGMKLGSFLLFTEAEIGTILTDNVLGTRLRSPIGHRS